MVIIDCNKFKDRDEYVASLSKRAIHEYRLVQRRNADLTFKGATFDQEKLHRFMELWGRQLVRGKPIAWAYPVETVANWMAKGEVILLEAVRGDETIAMHFLKKEQGFWDAGPPMWDKEKLGHLHLGTYMWFHTIFWCIDNKLGIINLGGGLEEWREMIRRRKEFKNPLYKWRYVPRHVKQNPDSQPDYYITIQHESKVLNERHI